MHYIQYLSGIQLLIFIFMKYTRSSHLNFKNNNIEVFAVKVKVTGMDGLIKSLIYKYIQYISYM